MGKCVLDIVHAKKCGFRKSTNFTVFVISRGACILNRPIPDDPVTDVEIDPIINEISTDPITKAEIRTALRKMKKRESRGQGRNYSRIIKSRHEYNREMACQIIQNILGTRESAKNVEAGTDR